MLFADILGVTTDYLLGRTEETEDGLLIRVSDDEYGWIMLLRSVSPDQREMLEYIKTGFNSKNNKKPPK